MGVADSVVVAVVAVVAVVGVRSAVEGVPLSEVSGDKFSSCVVNGGLVVQSQMQRGWSASSVRVQTRYEAFVYTLTLAPGRSIVRILLTTCILIESTFSLVVEGKWQDCDACVTLGG
ncbi:hypothetical protein BU26DRAFT_210199 [Trematosphaeria pertusa]|uniref:Secreted protein n=1 Tax=Trematosphaeria pertusa TaxID=390896 RepID=A0A6A6IR80_9PLEO|nr:uncharacterized protein BU26DRAFT_210199 [Trematosphaeria pertusa]KAF2252819.1 hypothetical protein BU26DRAFT_210199 [Trematosphaeria pertusa]